MDGCRKTPIEHVAVRAGGVGSAEMADLLLRSGGDERKVPANIVGKLGLYLSKTRVSEMIEEFDKVRTLLANAPADRAWRRRGPVVLDRFRFLSDSSVRVEMEGGRLLLDTSGRSVGWRDGVAVWGSR